MAIRPGGLAPPPAWDWRPEKVQSEWRALAHDMVWGAALPWKRDIYGHPFDLTNPVAGGDTIIEPTILGPGFTSDDDQDGTPAGDHCVFRSMKARARIESLGRYYSLVMAMKSSTAKAWEAFFAIDLNDGGNQHLGIFVRRNSSNDLANFMAGYDGTSNQGEFSSASGYLLADGRMHVYCCCRNDQTAFFDRDGQEHSTDSTISNDAAARSGNFLGVVLNQYRIANSGGNSYVTPVVSLYRGMLPKPYRFWIARDPYGPFRPQRVPHFIVPGTGQTLSGTAVSSLLAVAGGTLQPGNRNIAGGAISAPISVGAGALALGNRNIAGNAISAPISVAGGTLLQANPQTLSGTAIAAVLAIASGALTGGVAAGQNIIRYGTRRSRRT